MTESHGRWRKIRELGSGGQGTVYLVKKRNDVLDDPNLTGRLADAIQGASLKDAVLKYRAENANEILNVVRDLMLDSVSPQFALKQLRPEVRNQKSVERLRLEIETLGSIGHPSIVSIHESNSEECWFVMDYYDSTLTGQLQRTKGDFLSSLDAIRPIVEAAAHLHEKGIVHRDIKPDNIFAGSTRLVLGDFGLACDVSQQGRLTDTFENVGSRDWMPGWAMGMRLEDVKPTFDVFSLGKVLWSMISGSPRLRLWYHHDDAFELERMFPTKQMKWARNVLDKCIVEHEADCLPSAREMLRLIDSARAAVSSFGELPSHGPFTCTICRVGSYTGILRDDASVRILACSYCGNMQSFRPGH